MGLKYKREYDDIIQDLTDALLNIKSVFEFLEMSLDEWETHSEEEKKEYAKTLADDVFYGLGIEDEIFIGDGVLKTDKIKSTICVYEEDICKAVINL